MTLSLFSGRLKINVLFLPVLLYFWNSFGMLPVLAFVFSLCIHEFGHYFAAKAFGVRLLSFELLPFGCAANLESFALVSAPAEVFIAASGPALNMLSAALTPALLLIGIKASPFLSLFSSYSLSLAAVNLLPILPLDGGRILSAVLSQTIEPFSAAKLCLRLGLFTSAALFLLGIYCAVNGELMPTLLLFSSAGIYSSFKSLKNAAYSFIRRLDRRQSRSSNQVTGIRHIAAPMGIPLAQLLAHFSTKDYNIVHFLGKDMKIAKSMDEAEFFSELSSKKG